MPPAIRGTNKYPRGGWHRYFGFRLPPSEICCDNSLRQHVLAERLVDCKEVQRRVGGEIPEEDTLRFIRPYENKKRLDALRSSRPREP